MSRLGRLPAACAALALAFAAPGTPAAPTPPATGAVPWGRAFAGVADTALFFSSDGALWRAPFDLASRQVIWAPRGGERLARLRVSPDGSRYAFLTRIADEDTTRLWTGGPGLPVVRTRFYSLLPYRWDRLHFEALVPTVDDPGARGARMLDLGPRMWGRSSNTLDWAPDGESLVFGFNDGIASLPADSGGAVEVTRAMAMALTVLDPSPIVLVNAIAIRHGLQDQSWYLLYPGIDRWRAFPTGGLQDSRRWVASPGTVWWVAGPPGSEAARSIRAVRVGDPTPTLEVEGRSAVSWLGYDPARRALSWATAHELRGRPEDGGADTLLLATRAPIRAVLGTGPGEWVAVAGDSLWWWTAAGLRALGGAGAVTPAWARRGAAGELLVGSNGVRDALPMLYRADADAGALLAVATPGVKGGRWAAIPDGTRLVLFAPGPRAPATLRVYDVAARTWLEVANPGITGWEPLR